MSAINDALRRASSAAKYTATTALPAKPVSPPPPPPPPPPGASTGLPPPAPATATLPPIISMGTGVSTVPTVPRKTAKARSKAPLIIVIVLVILAGGAGGYFLWQHNIRSALVREKTDTTAGGITDKDRMAALFGDEKALRKVAESELGSNSFPAASKPASVRVVEPAPKTNPVVVTVAPSPAPRVATPSPAPAPQVPVSNVRFPTLRLQSIFYLPSNPSVMINGKTLYVSDEISGVTVADIQQSSVTLVLSGQTNILTLR